LHEDYWRIYFQGYVALEDWVRRTTDGKALMLRVDQIDSVRAVSAGQKREED
jgi:hypothetical protein